MQFRSLRHVAVTASVALSLIAAGRAPDVKPPVTAASVRGSVRFSGTAPAAKPLDMTADEYCAQAQGGTAPTERPLAVDGTGGVRDVVVYVKQGLPSARQAPPAQAAVLDQQQCVYSPRVVALQVGQTLLVRNSDETLHNVHVSAKSNREFNIGQPLKGLESRRTFARAEVGIGVSCDVHRWMRGAIAVFDHPYFAVTSADGSFSLDGLPPGEYVIEAWHETLGTKSQRVVVKESGTEPPDLVIAF